MSKGTLNSQYSKRLAAIGLFMAGLFSLLIAQFYKIQIVEGDKWTKEAKKQHFLVISEPFLRGKFYSNTSIKRAHPEIPQSFVIDVEKYHLHIDPESIPSGIQDDLSNQLSAFLDLDPKEKGFLRAQLDYESRNRKIAMWLDRETRDAIMEWWLVFARKNHIARNALFFVNDYQRSYPFGKLLGQVLHTIQGSKDEITKQAIPTGGLELYFNKYLQGKLGKKRLMRSPRNALETGEVIANPENGADVYLTINHSLQSIAEEELAKGVKQSHAKGGWAVMMDPKTGEILALAQYPFFYPPDYQDYFNDTKLIEHTRIKAITDANEPGSVMKPITLAVALRANEVLQERGLPPLFDPEEKMPSSNSRFPGRSKPLKDTHTHNFLNMYMALQKSANIYMARLMERVVNRLGNEFYREVLQDFGFGEKTGVELPYETKGSLPTPGKKHPNGTLEWSTPTPFSMAIGHNILVTGLQLTRAYAIFANGGYLVEPTLVRKIVKVKGDGSLEILLDNTRPERVRKFPRIISEKNVKLIVQAMRYTTKTGGTARRADIFGFTEAGKTATANKIVNGGYSETLYVSSFVGFTPVKDPAFVLLVSIDEPEYGYVPGIGKKHHGGHCAAPVFKEIAKRSLEYLGIPPDDPFGYPPGDPRYDPNKAEWVLETRLLKEKYEKWNNSPNH